MNLLAKDSLWGQIFAIGFGLISFAAIFYGAAIIATFFWATVAEDVTNEECAAWGTGTLMLIFALIVFSTPVGILFVLFLGFVMSWFFRRGMIFGGDFWKQRRWRKFLGLTNDYERDDKS